MNESIGKGMRYIFLFSVSVWAVLIALTYLHGTDSETERFTQDDIIAANERCAEMGGKLLIRKGLVDHDIGKVINLYCVGLEKPQGQNL